MGEKLVSYGRRTQEAEVLGILSQREPDMNWKDEAKAYIRAPCWRKYWVSGV